MQLRKRSLHIKPTFAEYEIIPEKKRRQNTDAQTAGKTQQAAGPQNAGKTQQTDGTQTVGKTQKTAAAEDAVRTNNSDGDPAGVPAQKPKKNHPVISFILLLAACFILYIGWEYVKEKYIDKPQDIDLGGHWFSSASEETTSESADTDSSAGDIVAGGSGDETEETAAETNTETDTETDTDTGESGGSSSEKKWTELTSGQYPKVITLADTEPLPGPDSTDRPTVLILSDARLGLGYNWTGLFAEGAAGALTDDTLPSSAFEVSHDRIAGFIAEAAELGYAGIIIAGGGEDETIAQAVNEVQAKRVPVIYLGNHSDGYRIEAPDNLGAAMMKQVQDRMTVFRGFTEGDDASFSEYFRAVQNVVAGLWKTGNSAETRKQFMGSHFLQYEGDWTRPGGQRLKMSSSILGISRLPDQETDAGCILYLPEKGDQKYYLYADQQDFLENHWGEDGYSASDSLVRDAADRGSGSEGGNSTYFIDMSSAGGGDSEEVTLTGTISSFQGYYNETDAEECLALNLYSPLRLKTSGGEEMLLYAVQLNGDDAQLSQFADSGKMAELKGTFFEEHTVHHYTPVVLTMTSISESSLG